MEFDLKGFFDNVVLEALHNTIWRIMKLLPKSESAWLRKLNRSIPIIPDGGATMDEPDLKLHYTADLKPNPNHVNDPEARKEGLLQAVLLLLSAGFGKSKEGTVTSSPLLPAGTG
jgi:hypothetical protein